jgi:hypothetical protein
MCVYIMSANDSTRSLRGNLFIGDLCERLGWTWCAKRHVKGRMQVGT